MTIENGRPADESGRLEKETAVYDLLEQLDIPFTRADHEPAFTMDACEEVAAALETKICKNLFLCNRQKTSFYLLLMPGDKPFHTKEITSQLGCARLSFAKEEALEQLELIPFRRAIEAGVPAIMMSHVLFPNIEPEQVPCTMSRRMVTGLLKQKLGFRGLILTDCMEMGAIRDYYGTPEGVVASIKAGVDLAEISSAFDLELAAAKAVNEAAERGEFDVEEIRASVEKILCYKKMLAAQAEPGLCNQPEDRRAAESMARQAISQISGTPFRADENTFFCGCADYRASGAANADGSAVTFPEYMANAFGAEGFVTGKDPDEEEIRAALRQAENCEKIILGTCNGHLFRGQLALAEALAAAGKLMAVAALRNPYDLSRLPETVWKLAAYDYAVPAFRALEDIFRGGKATGVCPVKLL